VEDGAHVKAVKEKDRTKLRTRYMPRDIIPVTYFLQLGPAFETFHHLSIVPPNYESISGLTY
jgi:hypothetical protein